MNRIGSALQRFIIVIVVLSVVMPFGLSTTTANEATTEEPSVDQTSVQDVEGTTVIDDAGSDDETATAVETADVIETATATETATAVETAAVTETAAAVETVAVTESATAGDDNLDAGTRDEQSVSVANDQTESVEVTPAQPTITGGSCVDGVYTPPSAAFGSTTGVTYDDAYVVSRTFFGQVVVDTRGYATLMDGYTWAPDLGEGWDLRFNGGAEYRSTVVAGSQCEDREVVPAQPVISGGTCVDGAYTPPSATFGPTLGVQYGEVTTTARIDDDGQVVVDVSASAWLVNGSGYIWMDELGQDWHFRVDFGTATYEREYIAGDFCGEVALAQPTITGNTCVGSRYNPPSATFGPTEHVTYGAVDVWLNNNRSYRVSVSAEVEPGIGVAMPFGAGWVAEHTPDHYYYSNTIMMPPCEGSEVVPGQPTVTGSTCVNGVYTPPSAIFGPTEDVWYGAVRASSHTNADGQVVASVSVSAWPVSGHTWAHDLGAGWQNSGAWGAYYSSEHIVGSLCGEVTLAQPTITGNTCVDGKYVPPTATFGSSDHATYDQAYTRSEFQDGRYVVVVGGRATLTDGYTWAAELGDGWEPNGWQGREAYFTGGGEETWNFCDASIILAPPTITGNTCSDGIYTLPEATFGPTDHVRYGRVNVSEGMNGTFVVTADAVLDLGYNWAQDESPGWTLYTGKGSGNFYQGVFQKASCEDETGVTPIDPVVTQASRGAVGAITPPSVTPATTAGITYTLDGDVVPGGIVTVTATPNAGYTLGPAVGWTAHDDGSATFTVLLGTVEDEIVTPGDPSVTQAVRTEAGAVTPPSVTPATTAGITYTLDGDVAPGSTVTITATPNTGYSLGPAAGWVIDEDGTATFAVQLDAVPGQPTSTATATATATSSPTATAPVISTATPTATSTSTATVTQTPAATPTATSTQTPAATPTATGIATATTVIPENPVITQAGRTDSGAVTPPSVIPAITSGITYTLEGDVVPGGIVTVTATPNVGYALEPGTGWTIHEDGTATFVVHLDAHPDAVEHEAAVTPEGAAYPVAPDTTAARQDTDTTVTGAHVTALPNTGTGGEARGGHDAVMLMLSAFTLALVGITVAIRLRGQRT